MHDVEAERRTTGAPRPVGLSAPARLSVGDASPTTLCDFVLALLVMSDLTSLILCEQEGTYRLSCHRSGVTMRELEIAADVGVAITARLAALAGLDPLIEAASPEGRANVARLNVRLGADCAELLITIGVVGGATEIDVRLLRKNGKVPEPAHRSALQQCTLCGGYEPARRPVCSRDAGPLVDVEETAETGGFVGVYRLGAVLGEGGAGAVFEAEHVLLGRKVAIKVLSRALQPGSANEHLFLVEARAASRLRHPNIVEVTDFGLLGEGYPYIVMERIEGQSLDAKLLSAGSLPPPVALRIAREVAVALAAAHAGGVVHNDLKPLNVMILPSSTDDAPRLKLVDFGASTPLATGGEAAAEVQGSPAYMSPEHIAGQPTDERSDGYALGVMLFEMLSGDVPFSEDGLAATLYAHVNKMAPTVISPHGALPLAVTSLVHRALQKRPEERHQSAQEIVADIDRALEACSRVGWRKWMP